MSEVTIISPHKNLVEVVASHLTSRNRDYSKNLVLFPGRRPAYFLYRFLARQERASLYPPQVFSIDDLIEFLLNEQLGPPTADRKRLETVDAVAILYEVHQRAKPSVGGTSYTSLDAFFPLGVKLVGELEEIALADVPPQELREKLQSVQYPKYHSLWYYYLQFYDEVERRGLATRSTQYRMLADALDRIGWNSFERIIVAGFYAFTNVERRIMRHLRKLERVSFIFQEGIGLQQQLRHLDIEEGEIIRPEEAPKAEPAVHFYQAPDTHGQIFGLAAKLQEQLRRDTSIDEKTVVVLPSAESMFPVIHGALSILPPEDYNISLGYPLSRTPLYGFLNVLMELAAGSFNPVNGVNGKFSPAAYVQFILHPYTKNIRLGSRSDVTRMMFHKIEEYLGEGKRGILFSLDELEADEELCSTMRELLLGAGVDLSAADIRLHLKTIHDNTVRKFQHFASIKDFSRKMIEVLSYIYQHSTAKLHPLFHPYSERCVEVFDRIGSSLLGEKSFDDLSGYFAFLRHALADVTVPFSGTPVRGLQVLGLLETRNLQFDTVYFLDANDDVIPGRPPGNMFLPQSIRRMLGLETYHDRDRLKEYYFDLAVRGAKEVHLLYTETHEGRKEKSRFVEKLLWKYQRRAKTHLSDEFVADVRYRANLAHRQPTPVKKTAAMIEYLRTENSFSTSQLDAYLKCPLKFYYRTVLGLKESADASDDVDQRDIGNLVHAILKELFASAVKQRLSPEHLTEDRLRAVVDRCFGEHFGKELIGPPYFLKQQVMIQLRKFLKDYQLPKAQQEQIVIEDLEAEIQLKKNGFSFYGKIDRVEKRDGKVNIIDYKTGKDDTYVKIKPEKLDVGDRDTWGKAIGSFQLPMYVMLYSESTKQSPENIEPLYLFLGRNRLDESIETGLESKDASAIDVYRSIEQVIFKLVGEIVDASVDFTPTKDFDKHCPSCPYSVICGTQWSTTLRSIY